MAVNFGSDPGLSGSIPVPLTTTGPDYAVDMNTIVDAILDRWQQAIQTGDISIDADLDMNSFRHTTLSGSSYINHGASVDGGTFPRMLYFRDNELYANDGSGNEVKITSGGSLNLSVAGGITGDYSTTSADANYKTASGSYFFTKDGATPADINVAAISASSYANVKWSGDKQRIVPWAACTPLYDSAANEPGMITLSNGWFVPNAAAAAGTRKLYVPIVQDTNEVTTSIRVYFYSGFAVASSVTASWKTNDVSGSAATTLVSEIYAVADSANFLTLSGSSVSGSTNLNQYVEVDYGNSDPAGNGRFHHAIVTTKQIA